MSESNSELLTAILAACEAGLDEASSALKRELDASATLAMGSGAPLDRASLPEAWDGPGLVAILQVGEHAALIAIAEASGVLPPWYRQPDVTGKSKLATLAQELGMLLLPESHLPEAFQAAHVDHIASAIERAALVDDALLVSLPLTCEGETSGELHLIWSATQPDRVFDAPVADDSAAHAAQDSTASGAPEQPFPAAALAEGTSLEQLPSYARSLLRIRVPLMVNLASKRQPIGRIVELESGAIIQFDKSCDELLELHLGNQKIAVGEAVKVGDKFGLRISSLVLPEERFLPVRRPESA